MDKKQYFSITVMKIIFTVAIFQLFAICLYLLPPAELEHTTYTLSLSPYIPEYVMYAVLTTVFAPISYYLLERIKNK